MAVERVTYVTHQGQRVLVIDISNGRGPEIAQVIRTAAPLIRRAEKNSVLTLTDVTNVIVRDIHASELVEFVKDNKPYVRAAAVVGVGDLAGAMLATTRILTGRQLKSFASRREALDWLVGVNAVK